MPSEYGHGLAQGMREKWGRERFVRRILNNVLDALRGPRITPQQIADRVYCETLDVPTFGPADLFQVMLERLNKTPKKWNDEFEAAVIRACRKKAGL